MNDYSLTTFDLGRTGRPSRNNVGKVERGASVAGGTALVVAGLSRRGPLGFGLAAIGGALLWRGATGHCDVYDALGFNTVERQGAESTSIDYGEGIRVEKAVTIGRSASDLFQFWRKFDNLPRFMNHLESVTVLDNRRSHWVAKAPAGTSVEWDAEVINEIENTLIGWRSTGDADVDNAGSVHFERAPGGRGTIVKVVMRYDPPGGKLGATVARLFGENPEQQLDEDLRRFKQLMETGEIPTTAGQSSGR